MSKEKELQLKYGTNKRAAAFYDKQMLNYLNDHMKAFLKEQSLMFISTSDMNGHCDSSLRHGAPGFIRVINHKSLIYPEYRGNGVMASLGNIVENPHIGLLIIDFFNHQVGLHINGSAKIIEVNDLHHYVENSKEIIQSESKLVERFVYVEVDEAYIHCSKHIPKLTRADDNVFHYDKDKKSGDYFKTSKEN